MGSSAGNILKTVLPIAISFAVPALAPALGITSGLGTAALGAGLGAAGGAITGGGLKGALLGGLSGGLGSGGADMLTSGLGLSGAGASIASKALTGAATGALSGGGRGALIGAAGGGIAGGLSNALSGGGGAGSLNGLSEGQIGDIAAGDNALHGAPVAANSLTSGGPLGIGGGGASSFGGSGGTTNFTNLLSGIGNAYTDQKATNQLVKSQQQSLDAFAPILRNSTNAGNSLATALGTNGNTGAANFGALAKAFSPADLQNEPGYQFTKDQGTQALNNSLAAGGLLGSGAAIKGGQQFAQGLADTTYGNAFGRDLAQKTSLYDMLSGAASPALGAAGGTADINSNIGAAQSKGTIAQANGLNAGLAGFLSGNGARMIVGFKPDGTPIYQ